MPLNSAAGDYRDTELAIFQPRVVPPYDNISEAEYIQPPDSNAEVMQLRKENERLESLLLRANEALGAMSTLLDYLIAKIGEE